MFGFYTEEISKTFNLALNTLYISVLKEAPNQTTLYVPPLGGKLEEQSWMSVKLTAQRLEPIYSDIFVAIAYRNLSSFFPRQSFLRIEDGVEVHYQIFSQIMTFAPIFQNQSAGNALNVTMNFHHIFSKDMIVDTNNERWEIKCGYADMGSFPYTWDIYTCNAKYTDDQATTCFCSKFGSYVLMLILMQPEVLTPFSFDATGSYQKPIGVSYLHGLCQTSIPRAAKEFTIALEGIYVSIKSGVKANRNQWEVVISNGQHKYVLECCFFLCIILTLFSTICLGTSCFIIKSSCLVILKLQCSVSIFLFEVLFAVAILVEPPQQYLMVYLTFLEMFLLLGISSHLSKLLIVFTELIEFSKTVSSEYTVTGIISGVPLITIFGNHLAYRTMDISLKSWWMIKGSLAFNIFVSVLFIMTGLFIFIYFSIIKKLKVLNVTQGKQKNAVKNRISLIRRAACLYFVLLGFAISSIVYINNQKLPWSIYQFGGVNVLLVWFLLLERINCRRLLLGFLKSSSKFLPATITSSR